MTAKPTTATLVPTEFVECNAELDNSPVDIYCGFAGDVEVEILSASGLNRTVAWTCPSCGTTATEDRDLRDC